MTRRLLIVGQTEFHNLVQNKAFIFGVVLTTVIAGGSIVAQRFFITRLEAEAWRFGVIDHTGVMGEAILREAEARNGEIDSRARTGNRLYPQIVATPDEAGALERIRLELSERVRRDELVGFVEIPAAVMERESRAARAAKAPIRFYSERATNNALPRWVEEVVGRELLARRLRAASIDPAEVAALTAPVGTELLGLVRRDEQGRVTDAREVNPARVLGPPIALMVAMYMVVMTGAAPLLNSVLEEKMSRISEVMLGSVTPIDLMGGKLVGATGAALVLVLFYVALALVAAPLMLFELFTPGLFFMFLLLLLASTLLFGSMFLSIGAACADLRDAQSMTGPAMILAMLPMLSFGMVIRDPDGGLAVALTLFPPSAPFILMLRLSLPGGVPLWQAGLSLAGIAAATFAIVWAAGKIFRVGMLIYGKSATFPEMLRWVRQT